jgi:hypothetical protein
MVGVAAFESGFFKRPEVVVFDGGPEQELRMFLGELDEIVDGGRVEDEVIVEEEGVVGVGFMG